MDARSAFFILGPFSGGPWAGPGSCNWGASSISTPNSQGGKGRGGMGWSRVPCCGWGGVRRGVQTPVVSSVGSLEFRAWFAGQAGLHSTQIPSLGPGKGREGFRRDPARSRLAFLFTSSDLVCDLHDQTRAWRLCVGALFPARTGVCGLVPGSSSCCPSLSRADLACIAMGIGRLCGACQHIRAIIESFKH